VAFAPKGGEVIETPSDILAHAAGYEAAESFVSWRKKIKKPLTETAALRIAKTLAAINAAGGDASDALGMAEERGWQSIKEEWYFGKRNDAARGVSIADATDREISFAARAARSPSPDCF
jgi:hypothetical protein